MKKYIIITSLFFILLFSISTATANSQQGFNFYNFLNTGDKYLIDYKLENMSLAEKVGQLFQVGFHSKIADEKIIDLIENYHIGGIIYFSRNIQSEEQTAELSNDLQQLALNSGSKIPLFIATDQEGGIVNRLAGTVDFPGNNELGAANDQESTQKIAELTAAELINSGINVNLAPVLDVNNNPNNPVIGDRSFGEDPGLVAEMGTVYIEALQSAGVAATAKHFPGHGDTAVDSHYELPIIEHQRSRLDQIELYPFKRAIEVGVEIIMTAHIYFPAIEKRKGVPATLSKAVLTDLLRGELNYNGLIITDCMEMKAIVNSFGTVEGVLRTIEAGSDLVLVSHSYQQQKNSVKAVIEAVKSGRITEKRIDTSVKRILRLKARKINLEQFY